MKRIVICLFAFISSFTFYAQPPTLPFIAKWQFRKAGEKKWYTAAVPGTIHTDLMANKLIPDPFYRDNESKVQWVEKENWEYKTVFMPATGVLKQESAKLVFDGLDTYAKVYLNGELVLESDNMFRQWKVELGHKLKKGPNELKVLFSSAVVHDDSLAGIDAIKLAGENNRMYSRKAQYQYGWDWGPRLVTCGIWKPIHWELWDERSLSPKSQGRWNVKLIQQPDSAGRSFYFTKDGKPVFIKGANWIPCESFIPRAKKLDLYTKLVKEAKEANINMLRIWGGGIYEDDMFYDLCDQYGIMVWQDFMFAGAMYPIDKKFYDNVEEEVRYQVERLKDHPCIVIWCGNNEIDEAWHNWGWQQQYGYSKKDSAQLWDAYRKIFHEMIPAVLKELDPSRPYWPSSPSLGWGRDQAYKEGDTHYWGVWWGKEPVEKYKEKTGRFMSEYGMQGIPSMETIKQFALPADMDTSSTVMKVHQKHPFGYANIKLYIENKFRAPKNFSDLVYVSQLMQADAIKTAIEAHRFNQPYTMGTMFWQWNDCWPVVSWSAVDYYARKKALFYQVKRSYAENVLTVEATAVAARIKFISEQIENKETLVVSGWFFDKQGKLIGTSGTEIAMEKGGQLMQHYQIDVPGVAIAYYAVKRKNYEVLAEGFSSVVPLKELDLQKPVIRWTLRGDHLELSTDRFAYGVEISLPDGVLPADNYFDMVPGQLKIIRLSGKYNVASLLNQVQIRSLADTYK